MPRMSDSAFEDYMILCLKDSKKPCVGPSFFRQYFRKEFDINYKDIRHFNEKCFRAARNSNIVGYEFVGNTFVYFLRPVFDIGIKEYLN